MDPTFCLFGSGEPDFNFKTGGSHTRLYIDGSNGRVGILNTAPNGILHVGTGTNADVTVGSQSNPAIQIGGTNNYRLGMYTDNETGYIENKNGDDGIGFVAKTTGEVMRITTDGKVGINTTNPYATLRVKLDAARSNDKLIN